MCVLRPVLQARSESEEGPEDLSGCDLQGQAQEGEPEEMVGGESGLFQGPVQRN